MLKLIRSFALLVIFLTYSQAYADNVTQTPLESNNYQSLPNSEQISGFLHDLTDKSSIAKMVTLGKSAGGRDIEAVLISQNPNENKITAMLMGSQHATEESGAEALQMLVRDLLTTPQTEWLNHMNLVVIVNANPDGRDNNSRFNETNGNINIDYVSLKEDETLVFVNALRQYQPHIIIDLHEASANKRILTNEQGYVTNFESQFDVNNNPNIAPPLNQFANDVFLPEVMRANTQMGVPARHYQGEILQLNQPLSHAGLRLWNFRNFSAMNGSISVLVENRLDPRVGHYATPENIKERTRKQKVSAQAFLETASKFKDDILKVTKQARDSHEKSVLLRHERVEDKQKPFVTIELINVKTGKKELHKFPNFAQVKNSIPLTLPQAYLITAEQERFAKLFDRHDLSYETISTPRSVDVVQSKITTIELLPHLVGETNTVAVNTEEKEIKMNAKPGDLWILLDQPMGRLIPILLEPRSSDSIFQEVDYRPLLLRTKPFFIFRTSQLLSE
ncbi:MAG: M14 family zinc carboxypeptidase [Legionellales bacterium]|jgi:hypothetical protein